MCIKIFPWDLDEEPFFTSKEEGLDWYIDKDLTNWANKKTVNGNPPLNAICFLVVKGNKLQTRVLIDKKTNSILHEEINIESMGCRIDFLRLAKNND